MRSAWRRLLSRTASPAPSDGSRDGSQNGSRNGSRSVELDLIIRAARVVVTTRVATNAILVRQLEVSEDVAAALLVRLEHCDVIAPAEPGERARVLTTSGELPGVIAEFERRG